MSPADALCEYFLLALFEQLSLLVELGAGYALCMSLSLCSVVYKSWYTVGMFWVSPRLCAPGTMEQ